MRGWTGLRSVGLSEGDGIDGMGGKGAEVYDILVLEVGRKGEGRKGRRKRGPFKRANPIFNQHHTPSVKTREARGKT